jgi:hypothetical protein
MSSRELERSGLPGAAEVPSAHLHIANTRVPLSSLPLRGSQLEAHANRIAGENSHESQSLIVASHSKFNRGGGGTDY